MAQKTHVKLILGPDRLRQQYEKLLEVTCLQPIENSAWFVLNPNKLLKKSIYQRIFKLYPNYFVHRYYWQDEWENDVTFEKVLELVDPKIQYELLCYLNILRDTN